jgi:hypothetical protein
MRVMVIVKATRESEAGEMPSQDPGRDGQFQRGAGGHHACRGGYRHQKASGASP